MADAEAEADATISKPDERTLEFPAAADITVNANAEETSSDAVIVTDESPVTSLEPPSAPSTATILPMDTETVSSPPPSPPPMLTIKGKGRMTAPPLISKTGANSKIGDKDLDSPGLSLEEGQIEEGQPVSFSPSTQ